MTVAAVVAANLPAWVLPEKTIFLPPKWGWHPSRLGAGYMRELSYYDLRSDSIIWRYDTKGRDIWGAETQLSVDMRYVLGHEPDREMARGMIERDFAHNGLIALPAERCLELPSGMRTARYV